MQSMAGAGGRDEQFVDGTQAGVLHGLSVTESTKTQNIFNLS